MYDMYKDNMKDYLVSMMSVVNEISNALPMTKNFDEFVPDEYLRILNELKWPLYFIADFELKNKIITAFNSKMQSQQINEIIYNFFSDEVLEDVEYSWDCCNLISYSRKDILSEAIRAHKEKRYHLSTAVFMCQVYGIAEDIVNYIHNKGLCLASNEKDKLIKFFQMNKNFIDKEKGMLFQMFSLTDYGGWLWLSISSYFKEVVLISKKDCYSLSQTQPLRNKICHGQQLNYGTQEHSLKSILIIDILINLAEELEWLVIMRDIMIQAESE